VGWPVPNSRDQKPRTFLNQAELWRPVSAAVRQAGSAQRVHACIYLRGQFVLSAKGKVGHGPTGTGKEMNRVQILEGHATFDETESCQERTEIRLQDLLPIAMVIVGGCESCAEKMVERALHEGSFFQDIDKTLRIVAGMQKLGCFANAVGAEVVSRMDKPLEAGRRTLEKAMHCSPIVS
jgi:hypothetical protein